MSPAETGAPANDTYDATTRAAMPEDWRTRLWLVRHGEVEGMARREVRGQRDVALSAHGEAQHAALVEWLAARTGPAASSGAARELRVLTSDLVRCRAFAEAFAARAGVPLELEPLLREQHMGAWQGQSWEAITAREGSAINDYWDDYWNAAPPAGESMAAMAARLEAWWQGAQPGFAGRDVVLVTHAGPIRALLARFFGLAGTEALRFAPPPASATVVAQSAPGFVLEGLGLGPDLAAPTAEPPTGPLRIALSGSAGTGKTTLGRALSEELGLPFIEEGMRARLEAGLELGRLSHAELEALHRELWAEQVAREAACPGGFVADRSSLDFAAFRLQYGFFEDGFDTGGFFAEAIRHAAHYSHVLLFPHGVLPLAADGVRAPNAWLQLRFQLCVEGLLAAHIGAPRLARVPRTAAFQERLSWARRILNAPSVPPTPNPDFHP